MLCYGLVCKHTEQKLVPKLVERDFKDKVAREHEGNPTVDDGSSSKFSIVKSGIGTTGSGSFSCDEKP